eukprot:364327-Chlamydomonas_euryale.AAC.3
MLCRGHACRTAALAVMGVTPGIHTAQSQPLPCGLCYSSPPHSPTAPASRSPAWRLWGGCADATAALRDPGVTPPPRARRSHTRPVAAECEPDCGGGPGESPEVIKASSRPSRPAAVLRTTHTTRARPLFPLAQPQQAVSCRPSAPLTSIDDKGYIMASGQQTPHGAQASIRAARAGQAASPVAIHTWMSSAPRVRHTTHGATPHHAWYHTAPPAIMWASIKRPRGRIYTIKTSCMSGGASEAWLWEGWASASVHASLREGCTYACAVDASDDMLGAATAAFTLVCGSRSCTARPAAEPRIEWPHARSG